MDGRRAADGDTSDPILAGDGAEEGVPGRDGTRKNGTDGRDGRSIDSPAVDETATDTTPDVAAGKTPDTAAGKAPDAATGEQQASETASDTDAVAQARIGTTTSDSHPDVEGGPVNPSISPLGLPILRWSSRTHSIAGIEAELGRIWSSTSLTTKGPDGTEERHVAARTSVMNLVVIASRPEIGEHAAAVIRALTGRHPSRTLILSIADPDGPAWLDAQVQAHCVLPREDAAETCAELIYMTVGGETGRHLPAIIAPLLVHDLPVTLWWPGEPPLGSRSAMSLLDMADRLVVDGSTWSGDGLDRLRAMERMASDPRLVVGDFALNRQSRWREAIASAFDRPDLRPFVNRIASMVVRYAAHELTPGVTNVVKPVYHVAWLASRLGMTVERPLVAAPPPAGGYAAVLRSGRRRVPVTLTPVPSPMTPGTTLAVDLHAGRGGTELTVEVNARAESVVVCGSLGRSDFGERVFHAPRRTEVELLAETIEAVGSDPVAEDALRMAAALAGPHDTRLPGGRRRGDAPSAADGRARSGSDPATRTAPEVAPDGAPPSSAAGA